MYSYLMSFREQLLNDACCFGFDFLRIRIMKIGLSAPDEIWSVTDPHDFARYVSDVALAIYSEYLVVE